MLYETRFVVRPIKPDIDKVPDLIDYDSDQEDDETDHFNGFKEKYGQMLPKQPDRSPNVGESVKNLRFSSLDMDGVSIWFF